MIEHNIFSLPQNSSALSQGLSRAFLGHPTAVPLRVDARAAGKNQSSSRERSGEICHTLAVDMPIGLIIALADTGAMYHHISIETISSNASSIANINGRPWNSACENLLGRSFYSGPTNYRPTGFGKKSCAGRTDIAAAGDQHPRHFSPQQSRFRQRDLIEPLAPVSNESTRAAPEK